MPVQIDFTMTLTISGSVLCAHLSCDLRVTSEYKVRNLIWCTGHCEMYLRWHSLRASLSILLHRADETQPGRNSCPRLQPYFIVSFVLVSRKVNFFTKSNQPCSLLYA